MQKYSSVQKRNFRVEQKIDSSDLNRSESLTIHQIEAELWLERNLNQLFVRLNNCLSSNPAQNANDIEREIYQTLVTQLHLALENIGVAIALADTNDNNSKIESSFRVCYTAPTATDYPGWLSTTLLTTKKTLSLRLKEVITWSDLQHLQSQEPQGAWPLVDSQCIIGWVISATPNEPLLFQSPAYTQLRSQLIERSLIATANTLAQYKQIQAVSLQCQQLESRNRELVRTNQLKSEFLANTSHEIRTPLSSILGFTHLLLAQGYNPGNLRHQEYLNIILTSGQHLLALLNDILDLSKIAANQLEVQWESVNVPELCRSVLTLVKEKASDKGLDLCLELDPRVTTLIADPLRLKQMLFNLLANALKFTTQGKVGLRVKYRSVFLDFTVWDTGTGISQQEQSRLFQPYTQIANVVGHQEGTGLGLAVTQRLAELHGGWVEVQSELNYGSQFTIVLPLTSGVQVCVAPGTVAGTIGTSKVAKIVEETRANTTVAVMVVEDNLHNAKLMTTYLGKLGYQMIWASNGKQMWEALKRQIPALILMDVHLPDIDGLELLQQLQAYEQYQKIPVIVQTAMAMKGDRENCLKAGAIDYISKPIDLKILATLVSKYINSFS